MTAAALICAACGAEVGENSKFCHECGARITLSANPAEYKQVTVLFADVVRSMDIAATLDVERLREVMTDLLERGTHGDLAEAQEAIDRLGVLWVEDGSAMRDVTLLRLRALLARARGDDAAYLDLVGRYRTMAESLGFEGHIVWAEAMT